MKGVAKKWIPRALFSLGSIYMEEKALLFEHTSQALQLALILITWQIKKTLSRLGKKVFL